MRGAGLGGWGLMHLATSKALNLRAEITELTTQKNALESSATRLWSTFKGLEPYRAGGKDYLLTPKGLAIRSAGMVGQREAWEIVRK